ncbi:MAG: hypothetical protein R3A78_03765 [Polyangiales bacterium]|nr:hypothetical protein [Myxococcales bacterium]
MVGSRSHSLRAIALAAAFLPLYACTADSDCPDGLEKRDGQCVEPTTDMDAGDVIDARDACAFGMDDAGVCLPECIPAEETCNGVDDDCDDVIDENVETFLAPKMFADNTSRVHSLHRLTDGTYVAVYWQKTTAGSAPNSFTVRYAHVTSDGTLEGSPVDLVAASGLDALETVQSKIVGDVLIVAYLLRYEGTFYVRLSFADLTTNEAVRATYIDDDNYVGFTASGTNASDLVVRLYAQVPNPNGGGNVIKRYTSTLAALDSPATHVYGDVLDEGIETPMAADGATDLFIFEGTSLRREGLDNTENSVDLASGITAKQAHAVHASTFAEHVGTLLSGYAGAGIDSLSTRFSIRTTSLANVASVAVNPPSGASSQFHAVALAAADAQTWFVARSVESYSGNKYTFTPTITRYRLNGSTLEESGSGSPDCNSKLCPTQTDEEEGTSTWAIAATEREGLAAVSRTGEAPRLLPFRCFGPVTP